MEEPGFGRFGIRTSVIVWGATVALLLGSVVSGEAASYAFKKLADTSGSLSLFGYPAINDKGTVAFSVGFDLGGTAVYMVDGTTLSTSTVADRDGEYNGFSDSVSLNNNDVVAFKAFVDCGGSAIYSSDRLTDPLADARGPACKVSAPFTFVGSPSMNDGGAVAFYGVKKAVPSNLRGIYKSDGTTVADTTTVGPNYGKFWDFEQAASISNGNIVTYRASDTRGIGIFTDEVATPTEIAHTYNSLYKTLTSPLINNKDALAFLATLDSGGSGVYMDNGNGPTLVSGNSNFEGFFAHSVNDGSVAFSATYNGAKGIFTGPDPSTDKVIAVGETLPFSESTEKEVRDLVLGREGLNNLGYLAFVVQFVDMSYAVYRADPVASDLEVVVDIKPGDNPNVINMKSNGKVPVAILTTDSFDATTVDPATLSLAGAPVVVKKNGSIMAGFEDVDADGRLDLVFHVETQALSQPLTQALNGGDAESSLNLDGMTLDKKAIKGSDSVRIVH